MPILNAASGFLIASGFLGVVSRSKRQGAQPVFRFAGGTEHDYGQVFEMRPLLHPSQETETIQDRHLEIGDEEGRQNLLRFAGAEVGDDFKAVLNDDLEG